jgi:hypothetical protein
MAFRARGLCSIVSGATVKEIVARIAGRRVRAVKDATKAARSSLRPKSDSVGLKTR